MVLKRILSYRKLEFNKLTYKIKVLWKDCHSDWMVFEMH